MNNFIHLAFSDFNYRAYMNMDRQTYTYKLLLEFTQNNRKKCLALVFITGSESFGPSPRFKTRKSDIIPKLFFKPLYLSKYHVKSFDGYNVFSTSQ